MDQYQKISRGNKVQIPAEWYNNAVDSARRERDSRFDNRRPPPAVDPYGPVVIRVYNGSSNYNFSRFAPLILTTPLVTPTQNLDTFQLPIVQASLYIETGNDITTRVDHPLVVALDPIPMGQIGRAAVAGAVPVQIEVLDESHTWAAPSTDFVTGVQVLTSAGDAWGSWYPYSPTDGQFLAGDAPGVPILWKDAGLGTKWAIVLLGKYTPPAVQPCVVAAVANVSLSGLQTIDNVTLAEGNRVLLTAQTTASQNGIWLAQSGSWTRPPDYPTGGIARSGLTVGVGGNTSNAFANSTTGGTQWILTYAPGGSSQTNSRIDQDATTWTMAGAYPTLALLGTQETDTHLWWATIGNYNPGTAGFASVGYGYVVNPTLSQAFNFASGAGVLVERTPYSYAGSHGTHPVYTAAVLPYASATSVGGVVTGYDGVLSGAKQAIGGEKDFFGKVALVGGSTSVVQSFPTAGFNGGPGSYDAYAMLMDIGNLTVGALGTFSADTPWVQLMPQGEGFALYGNYSATDGTLVLTCYLQGDGNGLYFHKNDGTSYDLLQAQSGSGAPSGTGNPGSIYIDISDPSNPQLYFWS